MSMASSYSSGSPNDNNDSESDGNQEADDNGESNCRQTTMQHYENERLTLNLSEYGSDFESNLAQNAEKPPIIRKKRAKVEFAEICESRRESSFSWRSDDSNKNSHRRGSDLKRFFTRPRSRSRSPTLISIAHSQRMQQPRLSLLGRPIYIRHVKQRDPRYRKMQILTHNFLDRPRGRIAIFYHLYQ
ncbi:hypothetical protein B4U79_11514 [Dinothrombium tinctorium]|uniref:Uncharacterized protein n=1 Tax=Dinothrombium tinctorium TaxID=1965070 RepID=A0A443QWL2_9ACAR|nr:hypothetical protein B4U79_11514 [Dinothrombium tinctorium]